MKKWPIVNLVAGVFIFFNLSAVKKVSAQETKTTIPRTHSKRTLRAEIEKAHSFVSKKIINASIRLDNLLGHNEKDDETPDSHVRVKTESSYNQIHGPLYKTKINTKISLPRTQKRLHVFFNNLDDEENKGEKIETLDDHTGGADKNLNDTLDGEGFSGGLRQMFLTSPHLHLHVDAGARLRKPIDPYLRAKARQSFEPGPWAVHFNQHAFVYRYNGYGYDLGVSFDRPLGYDLHLRQSNLAAYRHTNHYYELQHGLNLIQPLGKSRVLNYFVSGTGITEPSTHVTSYNFGVSYRRPVGWPWMIFTVTPLMNYPKILHFRANPGIAMQLETTFGAM